MNITLRGLVCLNGKSEDNKNKGQWLNIILVVVISAFITFMITSTYCKSKLAEADKLLSEESAESQDEHIDSALEADFDPGSENLKKLYANFRKHETYLGIYSDSYNDVGLMMVDSDHEMEEGSYSVYIKSEATFKNLSAVPIYMDNFEVSYQWDDEPSVSFQGVAYHDELADIEIDIEGIDTIVYPGEEITLTYDAEIEKNIAGEYGMSLYKFSHDYEYDVEYSIHTDDVDALED